MVSLDWDDLNIILEEFEHEPLVYIQTSNMFSKDRPMIALYELEQSTTRNLQLIVLELYRSSRVERDS